MKSQLTVMFEELDLKSTVFIESGNIEITWFFDSYLYWSTISLLRASFDFFQLLQTWTVNLLVSESNGFVKKSCNIFLSESMRCTQNHNTILN